MEMPVCRRGKRVACVRPVSSRICALSIRRYDRANDEPLSVARLDTMHLEVKTCPERFRTAVCVSSHRFVHTLPAARCDARARRSSVRRRSTTGRASRRAPRRACRVRPCARACGRGMPREHGGDCSWLRMACSACAAHSARRNCVARCTCARAVLHALNYVQRPTDICSPPNHPITWNLDCNQ
eukprot:3550821-Pleurochrysis_carterae.AAC.2